MTKRLSLGDNVVVNGLQKGLHLNGRVGKITSAVKNGRYVVKFMKSGQRKGETVSIKEENLSAASKSVANPDRRRQLPEPGPLTPSEAAWETIATPIADKTLDDMRADIDAQHKKQFSQQKAGFMANSDEEARDLMRRAAIDACSDDRVNIDDIFGDGDQSDVLGELPGDPGDGLREARCKCCRH